MYSGCEDDDAMDRLTLCGGWFTNAVAAAVIPPLLTLSGGANAVVVAPVASHQTDMMMMQRFIIAPRSCRSNPNNRRRIIKRV